MKIALEIESCVDCPHCGITQDPDPLDWFCDDDKKAVCELSDGGKIITSSCRPYQLRQECKVPDWCPRKV